MPTNDERRDVAARLRESREFISDMPKMSLEQNTFDVFERILACVGYERGNIFDHLAELIEPEPERTCKFIPFIEDDGSVFIENCSECDAAVLSRCEFNYCPNCGARVTEVVS